METQSNEANNPTNEGAVVNQSQNESNAVPQNEGKVYSQQELDNIAAKARGTAERETTKKLLGQLGLKVGDENMLQKVREAYENSLSDEERHNQAMQELQNTNSNLEKSLEEKDYTIQALIALSGKKEEDVSKIVKMAKGLKTDTNTIQDCIVEVMQLVQPSIDTNVPKGQPLVQPSTTVNMNAVPNPFKQGQINLYQQGKLIKENPELAKRLAAEAGITLQI